MCVKNGVFQGLVGLEYDPMAKIIDLIVLIPVTLLYNYTLNRVNNIKKFGITILGFFAIMFIFIALMLKFGNYHYIDGIPYDEQLDIINYRFYLGIFISVSIDIFISVSGTLFWSLTSNIMYADHGSQVYPVLTVCGQTGALIGSGLILESVEYLGFSNLLLLCSILLFFNMILLKQVFIKYKIAKDKLKDINDRQEYNESPLSLSLNNNNNNNKRSNIYENDIEATPHKINQRSKSLSFSSSLYLNNNNNNDNNNPPKLTLSRVQSKLISDKSDNKISKTGLLEGVKLILSNKYVFGLLVITSLPEFMNTLFSFKMKMIARNSYSSPELFSEFLAVYGMTTNTTSLIFAFTGTRYIVNKLGLHKSLFGYPLLAFIICLSMLLYPILSVCFIGVILTKSCVTALNTPVKELLYVHCSPDIKLKAKSWIDMFGIRIAKGMAASINLILARSPKSLYKWTPVIITIYAGWIYMCKYIGKRHEKLYAKDKHYLIT